MALALAGRARLRPADRHADRRRRQRGHARAAGRRDAARRRASTRARTGFVAPAGRRLGASTVVGQPDSDRLQLLEPFPPWDGNDYVGLPVLMKAQGKCTTDHISAAGPWLQVPRPPRRTSRGNLFLGAVNAFTGAAGTGKDVTRRRDPAVPRDRQALQRGGHRVGARSATRTTARARRASTPRWSRASATAAVIFARSFARIHETNLKKQGLLPLTFADPADYDKIGEDDRIDIIGLADLAPGQPRDASCIHHADGTTDEIRGQPHDDRRADRVVPGGLGAELCLRIEAVNRFEDDGAGTRFRARRQAVPGGHPHRGRAAAAIGCDVGAIVKSLVFMVEGTGAVLALTSGANRVDSHCPRPALRRQGSPGQRRRSARATGFAIGGTPPFGHPAPRADDVRPRTLGVRTGLGRGRNPRHRVPTDPRPPAGVDSRGRRRRHPSPTCVTHAQSARTMQVGSAGLTGDRVPCRRAVAKQVCVVSRSGRVRRRGRAGRRGVGRAAPIGAAALPT